MKNVLRYTNKEGTKPWIHFIRDGLNFTDIKMLKTREIEPIQNFIQDVFKKGFKFSYLNYIKDKTDVLIDAKGETIPKTG